MVFLFVYTGYNSSVNIYNSQEFGSIQQTNKWHVMVDNYLRKHSEKKIMKIQSLPII